MILLRQLRIGMRTLLLVGLSTSLCAAQQTTDPLAPLIAQFSSSTVQTRAAAFYAALALAPPISGNDSLGGKIQSLITTYPQDASALQSALLNLLALENTDTTIESLNQSADDEASGDFHVDLIEAVVSLKSAASPPVLLPALLPAIASGAMATNTLASLGPVALDGVLALVYSPDFQTRAAAEYTLETMLSAQYKNLYNDATSQSKIRAGLRVAVASFSGDYAFEKGPVQRFVNSLPQTMPGDLNGDGVVNCADLAIVKASFGKSVGQAGFDIRADVNGDGVVNILDLSAEAKLLPAGTTCQ